RAARIAEDRAIAQRARSEFHPALEPAHCLAIRERPGGGVEHRVARHGRKPRADGGQTLVDVALVELRAEIAALHPVDGIWTDALAAFVQVVDRERGAERAAGIARRRLHPDIAKSAVAQDLAVGDAIERDAAGEA